MAKLPEKMNTNQDYSEPNLLKTGFRQQEKIISAISRLMRYGWDLLGLLLIALGLILLLGSLRITKGVMIDQVDFNLARWFGIGRYLLALVCIIVGGIVVRWRKYPAKKIALGRIVAIEFAVFVFLGLISLINNPTITDVESGLSLGGIVGWGIAEVFSSLIGRLGGFILLTVILLILIGIGFNIINRLETHLNHQIGHTESISIQNHVIGEDPSPLVIGEKTAINSKTARKVEKPYIPPEFRKSFKVEKNKEVDKEVPQTERAVSLPPLALLDEEKSYSPDQSTINMTAGLIEKTLAEFGIPAKVVGYRVGPTVTQYAVEPGYIEKTGTEDRHKIRISQISGLAKDLALALKAERLRIEAPVPGKSYVGVEVPNNKHVIVRLKPILESEAFFRVNSPLAIPLGRDVSGQPVVSDLATMPHLLIAGTTNSGKSVCIASLTTCLVMNNQPEELKLVMIDPKMVELNRFNGLPHLLGQVETDIERIMGVLRWATSEMDYRYKLLEKVHARNLDSYNVKMGRSGQATLPRIVIMIDELADLMMSAPDQTEHALVRLAQKSRAVGMHLVVATQRPSTDVVTGVIKANFPTRIAFTVASSVDSRVILDTNGAETLLGRGDMLFLHPEVGMPQRSQGVMVTDRELDRVIKWWQESKQDQAIVMEEKPLDVEDASPWEENLRNNGDDNGEDDLINKAVEILRKDKRASASYLQRQLRIGYPRAARLIDQLEEMGILGPAQSGGKDREILIDHDEST